MKGEQPVAPPVEDPAAAAAGEEGAYEYYDEEDYGDENEGEEAVDPNAGIIQVDDKQSAKKEQKNANDKGA